MLFPCFSPCLLFLASSLPSWLVSLLPRFLPGLFPCFAPCCYGVVGLGRGPGEVQVDILFFPSLFPCFLASFFASLLVSLLQLGSLLPSLLPILLASWPPFLLSSRLPSVLSPRMKNFPQDTTLALNILGTSKLLYKPNGNWAKQSGKTRNIKKHRPSSEMHIILQEHILRLVNRSAKHQGILEIAATPPPKKKTT